MLQVARELAARQEWAIARRQLLSMGVGRERIKSWLGLGRLNPSLYRGIYIWGRSELAEKGQLIAGLLFTGRGSALDGLTALWWEDLLPRRPDRIHIAARGRTSSQADLRVRHPPRIKRHEHDGLPVVDLPRALLVATSSLDHNALRNVLARADFEDLLHLPSLQAACARGPKGSRKLRAAMDTHLPALARCVNDFERDFVLLCEAYGLAIPEPNVRMGRYVPDMLWRNRMLIVELDGKGGHTSAAQKASDATKQEWLEERGHNIIRFTWSEVYFEQPMVAGKVRAALAR